jgi:actin-like ATPase involved in cell morphogenesis
MIICITKEYQIFTGSIWKGDLMPANDIGIDLGTTNSLVYSTGRSKQLVKKPGRWLGMLLPIWK